MLKKKYVKSKDEFEVTFELPSEAGEATLLCSANGWEPVAMKKSKGTFTAKLRLPANGRFQYRYLIDGNEWANDEHADGYMPNEFGGTNSIVETYGA
jgi:hypothetical protein